VDDYQAVLDKLESTIRKLEDKRGQIGPGLAAALRAFEAANSTIDVQPYRQMITANRRVLEGLVQQEIDAFWSLYHGAPAPWVMDQYHETWKKVKGHANAVAVAIDNPMGRLGSYWDGPAASKYYGNVQPQVKAAARIGATADKAFVTLLDMHNAGLKFYVTIVGVGTVLLTAVTIALVNLAGGNVIGSILAIVAACTTAAAAITYAVVDLYNAQTKAAGALSSDAGDVLGFAPDGTWPRAVSEQFANNPKDRKDWVAKPQAVPSGDYDDSRGRPQGAHPGRGQGWLGPPSSREDHR
jgi:hypothetical protein